MQIIIKVYANLSCVDILNKKNNDDIIKTS